MPTRIGLTVRPLFTNLVSRHPSSPSLICRRFFPAAVARRADLARPRHVSAPPPPEKPERPRKGVFPPPSKAPASTGPDVSQAYTSLSRLLTRPRTLEMLHVQAQRFPALIRCLADPTAARLLVEEVSKRQPHRTPLVIRLALALHSPIKKNVYECASYHLSTNQRWDIVLDVFAIAKDQGLLTIRTLNWYTAALVNLWDFQTLERVLQEFEAQQISPNRRTYHMLLGAFIRNRDLRRAKEVMDIMQSNGIPVDPSTHAAIAIPYHSLGRNIQVERHTLSILPKLSPPEATSALNSMLKLQLTSGNVDGALTCLSHYRYSHIHPILQVLLARKDPDEEFQMSLSDVGANAGTYARVIIWLARQQDVIRVTNNLAIGMLRVGIPPTPELVGAMVYAYFLAGQPDLAVWLVFRMCRKRGIGAFKGILSRRAGPPALPFDTRGIRPTIRVFNSLFRGVLSVYGLDGGPRVLRIMRRNGVKPNVQTLSILVTRLVRWEGVPTTALYRLIRRFGRGMQLSPRFLHAIMSAMLRRERFLLHGAGWDRSALSVSLTRPYRPPPSPHPTQLTTTSIARFDPTAGLVVPLDIHRPAWVWQQAVLGYLLRRGTRSDAVMFALRLQRDAMRVDFQTSQEIFDVLLRRGFQANAYHYSALMEGFTRSGDIDAAEALLDKAVQTGITPNLVMYTILIVGHARQANPDGAMAVYGRMIDAGLTPDVAAIDALVSSFFVAGRYGDARDLLMELWKKIAPFPDHLANASLRTLSAEFRLLKGPPYLVRGLPKGKRKRLYYKLKQILRAKDGRWVHFT